MNIQSLHVCRHIYRLCTAYTTCTWATHSASVHGECGFVLFAAEAVGKHISFLYWANPSPSARFVSIPFLL